MKNTLYKGCLGPRRDRDEQLRRIQLVIDNELTPRQRQWILGYYRDQKSIPELAREAGLHKSTVCRTLQRAERRLRSFLRY